MQSTNRIYNLIVYCRKCLSVKGYLVIASRQVDKEITRECIPLAEEDTVSSLRGGKKMEWNWSVSEKPRWPKELWF